MDDDTTAAENTLGSLLASIKPQRYRCYRSHLRQGEMDHGCRNILDRPYPIDVVGADESPGKATRAEPYCRVPGGNFRRPFPTAGTSRSGSRANRPIRTAASGNGTRAIETSAGRDTGTD